MKAIGITGGIGAGKTLVCEVFKSLGIPVFNSDLSAKELMNGSAGLKKNIISLLGEESYEHGQLNRAYVAQNVFNDKEKLATLNKLVHPLVREQFKDWVTKNNNKPYVINEAALLIESGSYSDLDDIIFVNAPEAIRIKRVTARDKCNEFEVRARIKNQWSDEQKMKYCKWIINNDNSVMLLPQVLKIHKEIIAD